MSPPAPGPDDFLEVQPEASAAQETGATISAIARIGASYASASGRLGLGPRMRGDSACRYVVAGHPGRALPRRSRSRGPGQVPSDRLHDGGGVGCLAVVHYRLDQVSVQAGKVRECFGEGTLSQARPKPADDLPQDLPLVLGRSQAFDQPGDVLFETVGRGG
jgi:hypothetical protein